MGEMHAYEQVLCCLSTRHGHTLYPTLKTILEIDSYGYVSKDHKLNILINLDFANRNASNLGVPWGSVFLTSIM